MLTEMKIDNGNVQEDPSACGEGEKLREQCVYRCAHICSASTEQKLVTDVCEPTELEGRAERRLRVIPYQ